MTTQENIEAVSKAAELFKALGSPVRLAILWKLSERPSTVNELAELLDVSQPLMSQHLRVLRQHQLVNSTVNGQYHTYQLADEHVSHIVGDAIEHTRERS